MNVISKLGLSLPLKGKSLDVADEVASWFETAAAAHWGSIQDVRQSFPDADQIGEALVFNIPGENASA